MIISFNDLQIPFHWFAPGTTLIDPDDIRYLKPIVDDVDLDKVRKLKWNGITFKKGNKLWRVYDSIVLIGLYSYELCVSYQQQQ